MAEILLTIQHNGKVFSPPIEESIEIEWERTGSPGKLTFTTIKVSQDEMNFVEGDPVCFYYDGKQVFMGYVFTKSRDREHRIKVTCYDQIRYLKNKYTYVFENKTASQIVKALCDDFNLVTGTLDNTSYVIPAIAEENKSAMDIILDVFEETLLNTGDMYVLYDDFGKLTVKNVANMVSTTLIYEQSAENFDYSSSIDDETYNSVILYYKGDDEKIQLFTAQSPETMKQWGTLRYFEEVKNPTIGQNKANSLLKLYNKKTRDLKVSGCFGDVTVRGGTLIPVQLNLGDIKTNNYMIVESVTHKFEKDHYTMDLTLEGAWEDENYDIVTSTIGGSSTNTSDSSNTGSGGTNNTTSSNTSASKLEQHWVTVECNGIDAYAGVFQLNYTRDGVKTARRSSTETLDALCDHGTTVTLTISPKKGTENYPLISFYSGNWKGNYPTFTCQVTNECYAYLKWDTSVHTGSSGTNHGGGGSGF